VFDDLAVRLAEQAHGVVAAATLRSRGVGEVDIELLRASRQWDRPTPRVFRRTGTPRTPAQRVCIALLDAGPDVVLSHTSAAAWWGVRGCPLEPVHAVRVSASRRRSTLLIQHRVRSLPDRWTTWLDGARTVRPELCALQLFGSVRFERAERWVDALWSMRLLSLGSLAALLADLGRMGRNGTAGLRRYVDDRVDHPVPPGSGLESRLDRILRDAGIRARRQVDVGGDQWTGRVDFLLDSAPVIIEVQSRRHHTALSDVRRDVDRRSALRAAGFTVVEVWDDEVWTAPSVVLGRIRRTAAAHANSVVQRRGQGPLVAPQSGRG